jgi:hypothetical protein
MPEQRREQRVSRRENREHALKNEGYGLNGRWKELKEAILTPIDQPVVILLKGLVAISFPLEMHSGNAFGPAGAVIVKSNIAKRADSRVEQFLQRFYQNLDQ